MGYAVAPWRMSPVRVYAKWFAGATNYPGVPPGTYTWCEFAKLANINDPLCDTAAPPPPSGGPITGDPPESDPPPGPCGEPMSPGPSAMQTVRGYDAAEHLTQPQVGKLEPMPVYTDSTKTTPKYVVTADVRKDANGQLAVVHPGTGDGFVALSPAHVQRWHLYGDGGPAGTDETLLWPARLGRTTLLLFNGAASDGLSERDAVTRLAFGKCAATTAKPASGWYCELDFATGNLRWSRTDSEGADDSSLGAFEIDGKLTVSGEIDPTYLVMTAQGSARSMSANEVAFWGKDDGSGVTRPFITDDAGSTEEIQTVERHGGLLGTVTSTFTQANNTSEQTAASATMAANRASVGMLLRVRASGYVSNTSGGDVEFSLRVRFGGLSGQIIGGAATFTLATGAANKAWSLEQQGTFRSIGATGTIQGGAAVVFTDDVKVTSVANTPVTVDTTSSNAIVVTVQKDTASASAVMTLVEASVEILGLM